MQKRVFLYVFLCLGFILSAEEEIRFAKIGELTGADKGDVALGDLDGDGDLDLVVTGSSADGRVSEIFINNGKGIFSSAEEQPLEPLRYGDVAITDVDNDSDQDIILQGQDKNNKGTTLLYLNNGSGGFTKYGRAGLTGMYDSALAVGDVNADGFVDIISGGKINGGKQETTLFLGDGSGRFTAENQGSLFEMNRGDLKLADLDGDNDLDLLIIGGNSEGRIGSIYENDGDGFFIETAYDEIEPVIDGSLAIADVDKNGYPDILLCGGKDGGKRFTKLYMNNGDFSFSENESEFVDVFSGDLHFTDINNDSYPDAVISGNSLRGSIVSFYLNDASGYFDEIEVERIVQVYHSDIESGDLNGNGKDDLVITGLDYSFKKKTMVYRNNN